MHAIRSIPVHTVCDAPYSYIYLCDVREIYCEPLTGNTNLDLRRIRRLGPSSE